MSPAGQEQESGKFASLLDLLPVMMTLIFIYVVGGYFEWHLEEPVLDFAIIDYTFSILPWGMSLIACYAISRRFSHRPRWLRSFIIAAYTYSFWIFTKGPLYSLAQEATYRLRVFSGNYGAHNDGDFHSPWCFYWGNSGMNWGSGLAEIQQDTLQSLQGVHIFLPVGLAILLFLCFVNDYLIRLCQFTFKTASP